MRLLLLVHPAWAICNWNSQTTTLHNYFATLSHAVEKHDGPTVVTHDSCSLYEDNYFPKANKVVDQFFAALRTEPKVTVVKDNGTGKELCKARNFNKYTHVTVGGGFIELCALSTALEVKQHTTAEVKIDPTLCFKAFSADPHNNPQLNPYLTPGRALWEPF